MQASLRALNPCAPQLCGVVHHTFIMSLRSEGPCGVEDVTPRSCTEDAASRRPQGLQARGTDVTHYEDPGKIHTGTAPAHCPTTSGSLSLRLPAQSRTGRRHHLPALDCGLSDWQTTERALKVLYV